MQLPLGDVITAAILTPAEAEAIAFQASEVFTPRTPVTVRELFAGRIEQMNKVVDAVGRWPSRMGCASHLNI